MIHYGLNTNISKTTANRIVERLVLAEFLQKKVFGRVWQLTCLNPFHPKKISQNLERIYGSQLIQEIHQQLPNTRAIILFGSYRKGDDIETSDVDIAVEVLDNDPPQIVRFGT